MSMVLGRVFLVNPMGIWRHSYIPLRENVVAGRVLQYCRLPLPDDLCPTCCPSRLLTLPPPLDGCDKTPAVLVTTFSKTMASIVFNSIIVAVCLCVCLASAFPKKDSYGGSTAKKATSTTTKPPKAKCDLGCPEGVYAPVCANEKGSKEKAKSFGSICVMNQYNCEHGTNLQKESDGECKNGSGVRLA